MRTYIFTAEERRLLHRWLSGSLTREDSAHLHTTLGRLRRHQHSLTEDLRLLTLSLRRLYRAPKLRRRGSETTTALTIAPIPLHTSDTRRYVRLIKPLWEALAMVNDQDAPTETRLRALKLAADIALTLIKPIEEDPENPRAEAP